MKDCIHQIQPGLSVCVATSEQMAGAGNAFPGDKEYIHLNCQLEGLFAAKIKDVELECRQGHISMGYSAGEVFHVRQAQDFCSFALMVEPSTLHELAGEELAGVNFDTELEFFVKNATPDPKVTKAAQQVVALMQQEDKAPLLLHSATLNFLHWHLCSLQTKPSSHVISLRERKQLHAAQDFLLNDLTSAPTIAEISKAVGLNQCKLKKGFKALFGTSIYAHFQQTRMQRAKTLLSRYNVTETAMELGYSNVSHFSTAFRKQFGILPKEARKDTEPEIVLM